MLTTAAARSSVAHNFGRDINHITAASSVPNRTAAATDQRKICRCFW